jgi:hypothetical protein
MWLTGPYKCGHCNSHGDAFGVDYRPERVEGHTTAPGIAIQTGGVRGSHTVSKTAG